MDCETVRCELLAFGWDADTRRRADEILHHLVGCPACTTAATGYDTLRAAMGPTDAAAGPAGGWQAFDDRLNRRVERPIRSVGWNRIALAASLLLAIAGWTRYWFTLSPESSGSTSEAALVSFTPEEASVRAAVFDQVSAVFDRRTSWVLVSDSSTDFGLMPDPHPPDQDVLLLRLALFREGAVVSTADVMIVPGQAAAITVPIERGRRLRYHLATFADEPERLSLWLDLENLADGRQTLAVLATDLHVPSGESISVGRLVTDDDEYTLRVALFHDSYTESSI